MAKLFRTFALVFAALFALSLIVGCGGGEDEEEEAAAAAFASASPDPAAGPIAANATITVTFDNDPGEVTASAGTVSGSGKTRQIAGPFTEGALALALSWTNGDGSHTLNYTIAAADNTPPEVTGGNIADGDEDVDPEPLNADGGSIEITFSEEVTGNLAVQTEDGTSLKWTIAIDGNTATLEKLAGGDALANETVYVIKGTVSDSAGNELEVEISFTTAAKSKFAAISITKAAYF